MKVLLVGFGRWGRNHLRVLRGLGADVWVADAAPGGRAAAAAEGLPAGRVVADFQHALASVEAVHVVTPADTHFPIALACVRAGRHCLVEKPVALRAAEGRELARAARHGGRVLQVGHILRFHPVTAAMSETLAGERLGAIRYARFRFAGFKRPRTDVGVTHTDAVHFFDLAAHLLGREATRVVSVQRDFLGRGLDDYSLTVVYFGDVPVIVEADYFAPGLHRECIVVGERAAILADYARRAVTLHPGRHRIDGSAWEAMAAEPESLRVDADEALALEIAAFLAACAGRGPNLAPPEAAAHAVQIVEAAARSAAAERAVALSEVD